MTIKSAIRKQKLLMPGWLMRKQGFCILGEAWLEHWTHNLTGYVL
ncbi:MAG: hypothetical protein ACE5OZ_05305 [Candidatus Heimdallarchaeota archaeon]